MQRAKWIAATMAGIALCHGTHRLAPAKESLRNVPLSFATLATTDTMVLDVVQQGCIGERHYQLRYMPVPSPRVTVLTYEAKQVKIPVINVEIHYNEERFVGTVTLTPAQVTRLDNRLCYYRGKRRYGWTYDAATATVFRNGIRVHAENYANESCDMDTYLSDADPRDIKAFSKHEQGLTDARPVLSLSRLFEIAEKAGTQNILLPYRDLPRKQTMIYKLIHEQDAAR